MNRPESGEGRSDSREPGPPQRRQHFVRRCLDRIQEMDDVAKEAAAALRLPPRYESAVFGLLYGDRPKARPDSPVRPKQEAGPAD